ncbi:Aste57867_7263 [Aphanomyces stellatus]|uniref:Aste57867_7263 protein n=1 Tax=Aphanomyces stellatus TaxID=120398 RepID=A0A485KI27_9STRA|nr:hypothetical protein As57867_007238 [Aphanomyces stellatus]VFT84185.1 Aste57867_7263 [Aphanomyces stellatus]
MKQDCPSTPTACTPESSGVVQTLPRPNGKSVSDIIDVLLSLHEWSKTQPSSAQTTLADMTRMLDCTICHDVFTSATEVRCCGHVFCKACIEPWVLRRGSCPLCRRTLSLRDLWPARHVQRQANELVVACPTCAVRMKKALVGPHVCLAPFVDVHPPAIMAAAQRTTLLVAAGTSTRAMTAFLVTPLPPDVHTLMCCVHDLGFGHYALYTVENRALLCTAVRYPQSFGIFSRFPSNGAAVATLSRNAAGSEFALVHASSNTTIAHVEFVPTRNGLPRCMRVAVAHQSQDDQVDNGGVYRLTNKPPEWNDALASYCLDFGGRVHVSSKKNFILQDASDSSDAPRVLFGRTNDRSVFAMDCRHPLSPLQAFATALSGLEAFSEAPTPP